MVIRNQNYETCISNQNYENLSAWVMLVCCDYIYMVCLMRRLPFQYLFLTLLTNF